MASQIQVAKTVNENIRKIKNVDLEDEIISSFIYDLVAAVGGQSNAAGAGVIYTNNGKFRNPACLLYTKKETIEVCQEPSGVRDGGDWVYNIPGGGSTSDPEYGFLTSFANALINLTGIRPLMVPNAIGSTGFSNWLPPATEDDRTTLFGAMSYRVKNAQQGIKGGLPPLFIWYGHEANAGAITEDLSDGSVGTSYMSSWLTLVDDIRERFPGAPMIYVQLATHYTGSLATNLRKGAESQRLAESTYGDGGTDIAVRWDAPTEDYSSSNWTAIATDENNNINTLGDYSFSMVGNGDTILENSVDISGAGIRYKLTVTVTGTGNWKFFASTTQIGGTLGAGASQELDFVTSGTGNLRFVRNAVAQATNLVFTIDSLEIQVPPQVSDCHMAVAHDLPRNINDGYHLTPEGYDEIGYRLALLYAERVLGMHWINGTGPRLVSVALPTTSTVLVTFNKEVQADANDYGVNLAGSLFRVYDDGVEATLSSVARDSNTSAILITLSGASSGVVVVTYGDRSGPNDGGWRAGVVKDVDNLPAPMFGPVIAVAP